MTQSVKLADIRIDGGTQARAELNEAAVAEYVEALAEGATFPPVVVFFDGSAYWLADGFHRFHAHRKAQAREIAADVRDGTKRDAILHSVGANANHGLRRSNADKRRAVETLLADAEWSKWSDREIARQCAVSPDTVGRIRRENEPVTVRSDSERTYTTKHGTTAQMDTSNIGKAADAGVEQPAELDEPDQPQAPAVAAPPVSPKAAPQPAQTLYNGLPAEDRINELMDEVKALEGENLKLKAKLATFDRLELMYRDWTEGGWEKVIQAKDDLIDEIQRTAQTRIARESHEKVSNLKAMRGLAKKLENEGRGRDIYIDLDGTNG